MNNPRMRVPSIIAAVAGLALVFAACTAAKPTDIVIYTTPSPAPTGTPVPGDTTSPTPAAPTDTPAGGSGSPTASVAGSATPTPSPSPTGPAGGCAGSADTQAFFVDAAKHLKFAVYCGSVTKGWHFSSGSNSWPGVSTMSATYAGPSGAKIVIKEGAFCTTSASACSPNSGSLGTAHFGKLTGNLDTVGSGFAIYVNPGTTQGYTATGTSVTKATFVNIVAALYLVPKT